jgi:hypothetical protein
LQVWKGLARIINHGKMIWNKKKQREEMMNMIRMIQPTSKMAISQQCLLIAKGDIDEAKKLRDYFADVMPELPVVDQPAPTWVDNTKDTLNGILSWGGEHQQGLLQLYEIIRNMTGGKLPPLTLPGMAAEVEAPAAPLPPINEE